MKNRFFCVTLAVSGVGFAGAGVPASGQAGTAVGQPSSATVGDAKALERALEAAQPGDVILLRAGEWKDATLRIRGSGTAEKPITVRAAEPGKTVFVGESTVRIGGRFVVVDGLVFRDFKDESHIVSFRYKDGDEAEDCRLTNTLFERPTPGAKDADTGSYWVSVYGKRNRVDHCSFAGKRTMSPLLTVWVNTDNTSDDHRIDHNYFGRREPLGKNGGETIRVGTSQVSMHNSRTVVERNVFEHCNGEAEVISNKSCENLYRQNVFVECKGALVLRHGNRCRVEGNWFFGRGVDGTGGIRVIGEDHVVVNNYLDGLMGKEFESALPINDGIPNSPANGYFQVKRLTLVHNTIVNCAQGLSFGVGHGARNRVEPVDGALVANNLIVSDVNEAGPLVRFLSKPLNVRWAGNVLHGKEPGVDAGEGVLVIDPQLKSVKAAEAELRYPTNDAARVAPAAMEKPVDTDILGRPRGARVTAGAVEPEGEVAVKPVTRAEVGPAWQR
jgi:poly(beta-D-mannuronate) lyase